MAQNAETRRVVEAIRAGASDFIAAARLLPDLEKALGTDALPAESVWQGDRCGLSAGAPRLEDLAEDSRPLLILGEPDAGKARLARAVHARSARRSLPFVRIDCASVNAGVGLRDIAGYERGAFVGALQSHKGLLVGAGGGTVLFEAVHSLPFDVQRLVSEALATGGVTPLGGGRMPFEARVIATSHLSLDAMKSSGMRPDLLSRLAGNVAEVRPLRSRRDDLVPITRALLVESIGPRHVSLLDSDLCSAIRAYSWPGNFREMLQVVRALSETRNSRYVADLLRRRTATRPRISAMAERVF
ncbi:MAG: sigma-54-dependent Fis family transcriptional regulator [Acidobacteriota bacterium]|nr:sigma-54-dependent Fis family transcriptional regulator [Acidobacteriota bacterium]